MSNAPYCPISSNQPKGRLNGYRPDLDIAAVPPARDLPSVITAINAINNIVQNITRGEPQINNLLAAPLPPREPAPQYERLTWREVGRNYAQGRVVNPDDEEQVVEIKVVTRVTWREDATGHELAYVGQQGQ